MPYNPGIQDISGQLIAQGQSQANAARARAIESLGQSFAQFAGTLTTGMKQYQQNQFMTKQAMGKFGAQLEDPNFKKYVSSVLAEDPNAPVVPEPLKKAFKNAQKGDVSVMDAALLGSFADAYKDNRENQLREAQIAKLKSEAGPQGQVMSIADYKALIASNPQVDFGAKVLPNGLVMVQTGGARAPAAARPLAFQAMTGGVGAFDPETGELRRFTANVPEGAMPNDPRLLSMVPGQPMAAAPAPAPAAPAAAAPAIPPMLSRFQQAAEAPAGPMGLGRFMQAPTQAGPMASLGQFAGPPRAAAAAPAPAAAAAPAAPAQARGLQMVDIPGGKRDIERRQALAEQAKRNETRLRRANDLLKTIDTIEPLVGPTSVGLVGDNTKNIGGTPAANVAALMNQIQAATAFDELSELKESKTSLGQVAIKEIELLQNAVVALDQKMSPDLYREQLALLKQRTRQTIQRLNILERDRQAGLTEPSQDYYKFGGKTMEDLNREDAANKAPSDPLSALEKGGGWTVRK